MYVCTEIKGMIENTVVVGVTVPLWAGGCGVAGGCPYTLPRCGFRPSSRDEGDVERRLAHFQKCSRDGGGAKCHLAWFLRDRGLQEVAVVDVADADVEVIMLT